MLIVPMQKQERRILAIDPGFSKAVMERHTKFGESIYDSASMVFLNPFKQEEELQKTTETNIWNVLLQNIYFKLNTSIVTQKNYFEDLTNVQFVNLLNQLGDRIHNSEFEELTAVYRQIQNARDDVELYGLYQKLLARREKKQTGETTTVNNDRRDYLKVVFGDKNDVFQKIAKNYQQLFVEKIQQKDEVTATIDRNFLQKVILENTPEENKNLYEYLIREQLVFAKEDGEIQGKKEKTEGQKKEHFSTIEKNQKKKKAEDSGKKEGELFSGLTIYSDNAFDNKLFIDYINAAGDTEIRNIILSITNRFSQEKSVEQPQPGVIFQSATGRTAVESIPKIIEKTVIDLSPRLEEKDPEILQLEKQSNSFTPSQISDIRRFSERILDRIANFSMQNQGVIEDVTQLKRQSLLDAIEETQDEQTDNIYRFFVSQELIFSQKERETQEEGANITQKKALLAEQIAGMSAETIESVTERILEVYSGEWDGTISEPVSVRNAVSPDGGQRLKEQEIIPAKTEIELSKTAENPLEEEIVSEKKIVFTPSQISEIHRFSERILDRITNTTMQNQGIVEDATQLKRQSLLGVVLESEEELTENIYQYFVAEELIFQQNAAEEEEKKSRGTKSSKNLIAEELRRMNAEQIEQITQKILDIYSGEWDGTVQKRIAVKQEQNESALRRTIEKIPSRQEPINTRNTETDRTVKKLADREFSTGRTGEMPAMEDRQKIRTNAHGIVQQDIRVNERMDITVGNLYIVNRDVQDFAKNVFQNLQMTENENVYFMQGTQMIQRRVLKEVVEKSSPEQNKEVYEFLLREKLILADGMDQKTQEEQKEGKESKGAEGKELLRIIEKSDSRAVIKIAEKLIQVFQQNTLMRITKEAQGQVESPKEQTYTREIRMIHPERFMAGAAEMQFFTEKLGKSITVSRAMESTKSMIGVITKWYDQNVDVASGKNMIFHAEDENAFNVDVTLNYRTNTEKNETKTQEQQTMETKVVNIVNQERQQRKVMEKESQETKEIVDKQIKRINALTKKIAEQEEQIKDLTIQSQNNVVNYNHIREDLLTYLQRELRLEKMRRGMV